MIKFKSDIVGPRNRYVTENSKIHGQNCETQICWVYSGISIAVRTSSSNKSQDSTPV